MQYREYGKTGKMVSVLGFGTSRFRPEDYASERGQEKLVQLVRKANALGVNLYDTGAAYGDGRCEEILGRAFARMPGDFYISSKSHNSLMDADEMRRRLDVSLKRLNVEKIHFYHMWRILNLEQFKTYIRPGGPYDGAVQAQNEGLIDHICFSAHCDGDEIAAIAASGYFEGVILSYNIINFRYREEGLRAAKKHGLGVMIMTPLGGGVIPRNTAPFSFALQDGEDIVDVALNFCASHTEVSCVLSGMTNEEELKKNVAAMADLDAFPVERAEKIKSHIVKEFDSLCNGCRYCADCPQGIDVHKLMLSYNQYMLRDVSPRAFFEEIGNWIENWEAFPREPYPCVECGQCEEKCSQHIPIRERIAEINQLIEQRQRYLLEGLERCFGQRGSKKIGIYGAGEYAKEMLGEFREIHGSIDFPFAVFDSNPAKAGAMFHPFACEIHPPDDIPACGIERLIIASEDHYAAIYQMVKHYEEKGVEIVGFTLGQQYRKLSPGIAKSCNGKR